MNCCRDYIVIAECVLGFVFVCVCLCMNVHRMDDNRLILVGSLYVCDASFYLVSFHIFTTTPRVLNVAE